MFQFTHPGRGATHVRRSSRSRPTGFNSCTLGGVRQIAKAEAVWQSEFQFTHPGRGATASSEHLGVPHQVSIHAPWEGCDCETSVRCGEHSMFQFTHPGRGATSIGIDLMTHIELFQFTHPGRGATWEEPCRGVRCKQFQFTHPGRGATATSCNL